MKIPMLLLASVLSGDPQLEQDRWQDPNSCGLNSLVWTLRMLGVDCSRKQLESALGPASADGYSLLAIRDAAKQFGVRPQVRKVTVAELRHMAMPYILHTSVGRQSAGHFAVVYDQVETSHDSFELRIIDGSTGQHSKFTKRGLEKVFTGYVLTFDTIPQGLLRIGLIAYSIGICFAMLVQLRSRASISGSVSPAAQPDN